MAGPFPLGGVLNPYNYHQLAPKDCKTQLNCIYCAIGVTLKKKEQQLSNTAWVYL